MTTQAFHDLYNKSKEVQERFLNAVVKIEPNPIDLVQPIHNKEISSIVKSLVKPEPNTSMMESSDESKFNFHIYSNKEQLIFCYRRF